jgi:hypothetical protein
MLQRIIEPFEEMKFRYFEGRENVRLLSVPADMVESRTGSGFWRPVFRQVVNWARSKEPAISGIVPFGTTGPVRESGMALDVGQSERTLTLA